MTRINEMKHEESQKSIKENAYVRFTYEEKCELNKKCRKQLKRL